MSKDPEFRGVFAYPLTPTQDDGARVDEIRLCELIDEFIDAGARGIVVLGSTGAVGSFSEQERRSIAEAAARHVDGARRLFEKMFPVIEFVFEKSGVRAIHTALDILGRPAGAPRRPIRMLGKEDRATLEKLLRGCEDLIRWS